MLRLFGNSFLHEFDDNDDESNQLFWSKMPVSLDLSKLQQYVVNQLTERRVSRIVNETRGKFMPLSYWKTQGFDSEAIKDRTPKCDQETHPVLGLTYRVNLRESTIQLVTEKVREKISKYVQTLKGGKEATSSERRRSGNSAGTRHYEDEGEKALTRSRSRTRSKSRARSKSRTTKTKARSKSRTTRTRTRSKSGATKSRTRKMRSRSRTRSRSRATSLRARSKSQRPVDGDLRAKLERKMEEQLERNAEQRRTRDHEKQQREEERDHEKARKKASAAKETESKVIRNQCARAITALTTYSFQFDGLIAHKAFKNAPKVMQDEIKCVHKEMQTMFDEALAKQKAKNPTPLGFDLTALSEVVKKCKSSLANVGAILKS